MKTQREPTNRDSATTGKSDTATQNKQQLHQQQKATGAYGSPATASVRGGCHNNRRQGLGGVRPTPTD